MARGWALDGCHTPSLANRQEGCLLKPVSCSLDGWGWGGVRVWGRVGVWGRWVGRGAGGYVGGNGVGVGEECVGWVCDRAVADRNQEREKGMDKYLTWPL